MVDISIQTDIFTVLFDIDDNIDIDDKKIKKDPFIAKIQCSPTSTSKILLKMCFYANVLSH